jgi:predicted MFS family arabinose efflux permease
MLYHIIDRWDYVRSLPLDARRELSEFSPGDIAVSMIQDPDMLVIAVLWTAFFLINFNIAMMIPLLPFVQQGLGLSTSEAGWILAAFPIVALRSNLALGPWIDRFGRKRFIVVGAGACAIVFLLTAGAGNTVTLLLCRATTGLFMPMVGASIFAAIADYVRVEDRARVAGYVTTAAPIAFLLSMSMGFVLGGLVTWRLPLVLVAVVSGGLAGGAALLPATPSDARAEMPVTRHTYRARLLSLSLSAETRRVFLAYFCWSMAVFTFLGLYPTWIVRRGMADHSLGQIGTMLFLGEVGGLLGAALSGRLSRWHAHPLRICALAAFVTAAVVVVVPFAHGMVVTQALAYAGFAFGRDMMLALILGGAMLLVPAVQRGSLNALMNAIYQTGATAGGVASAWLYRFRVDFTANTTVAAALLVVSGASLWLISRRA